MKKYLSLFRYEIKNITRDPMNLYMCCFPFILLILSTVIFPLVFKSIGEQKQATLQVTMLLFLIIMLTLGTFFLSTLTALLLVENKDEHTFNTIAVTPVGTTGYLRFKMVYLYIMSVISSFIVLYGTKLIAADQYKVGGVSLFDQVGVGQILAFAAVNGLFVSGLSLFQSAFAQNKVEGFAFTKGTGIIALVPALLILDSFKGGTQYALGVLPNFWAIKGIMLQLFPIDNSANLSYPLYLLIGAGYSLLLLFTTYRIFLKKIDY